MDLAMRVARYFPMVVLTGLVCESAIPLTARAWDSPAVESVDQSSEPQGKGRIVDDSVQQANYYDSRPRNKPMMNSQPGSEPGPQKRALFRGESLNLPKMLFGRQTPTNRPAANAAQSASNPSASNSSGTNPSNHNNTSAMRPRATNQSVVAGRPMQQRVVNAPSQS